MFFQLTRFLQCTYIPLHFFRIQFFTLLHKSIVLSHGTDVSNDSATTLYVIAKS